MRQILETERLRLREFNLQDSKFIVELLNSPGWLKYIGDRGVKTEEQAIQFLKNGPMKSYAENGYGLSMVEKRDEGTPIGMCGIIKRVVLETPDIGFAFLPEFCGKGYAFEIASATLKYAEETLRLPQISAIALPENSKSIKLLEKLGLKYRKHFQFPDTGKEMLLFSN
jgi:RimJ/RimL family protein N-acetyltransferase